MSSVRTFRLKNNNPYSINVTIYIPKKHPEPTEVQYVGYTYTNELSFIFLTCNKAYPFPDALIARAFGNRSLGISVRCNTNLLLPVIVKSWVKISFIFAETVRLMWASFV